MELLLQILIGAIVLSILGFLGYIVYCDIRMQKIKEKSEGTKKLKK